MLRVFSPEGDTRNAGAVRHRYIENSKTISPDGAFLIAGAMHVRDDIAVPYHLRRYAPDIDDNDIAVVILVEADDPGEDLPGVRDYALRMGSENVADFMWFTNDLPRADPCEDIQIGQ